MGAAVVESGKTCVIGGLTLQLSHPTAQNTWVALCPRVPLWVLGVLLLSSSLQAKERYKACKAVGNLRLSGKTAVRRCIVIIDIYIANKPDWNQDIKRLMLSPKYSSFKYCVFLSFLFC